MATKAQTTERMRALLVALAREHAVRLTREELQEYVNESNRRFREEHGRRIAAKRKANGKGEII